MRREAETHAKEQVKIEEERKSVALALKELEPEALDRSIETAVRNGSVYCWSKPSS